MPKQGAPVGSAGKIRWTWLFLGVGGLALCIGLFVMELSTLTRSRPSRTSQRISMTSASSATAAAPAPMLQAPPPPQPQPPPPRTAQLEPPKLKAARGEREAPEKKKPPAPKAAAPKKGLAPPRAEVSRSLETESSMSSRGEAPGGPAAKEDRAELDDHKESSGMVAMASAPAKHKKKPDGAAHGKGGRRPPTSNGPAPDAVPTESGSIGVGRPGAIGHGARLAAGPDEEVDNDALAHLIDGHFAAKIPQKMLLHQTVRVYATISDKATEAKADAVIAAASPGRGSEPATVITDDVLVGKILRLELRAPSSEFEISAITPLEQPFRAGRVSTWEWAVIPREEGSHSMSMVITNLTDGRGRPIDLTVKSIDVDVDVRTVDKLKAVGGLISSAMSGVAGMFAFYRGVVRPLRQRKRDDEDDDDASRKKNKDASSGKGNDDPARLATPLHAAPSSAAEEASSPDDSQSVQSEEDRDKPHGDDSHHDKRA